MKTDLADLVAEAARPSAKKAKDDLFRRLELGSGLPGPRANLPLALDFAHACAGLGAESDGLAYAMANDPPDERRGATAREFLAMCGVLAVAARAQIAKEDAVRERALELLEAHADDVRFRVRDAVPLGLAMLGTKMRTALAEPLEGWMDRYFHAAAVLRALADPSWLETFAPAEHAAPLALLDAAFVLAHDAPRSAVRYPGHKSLVEAIAIAPRAAAKRFGRPVFDLLARWSEGVKIPDLRAAILANLEDAAMKKPFAEEIKKVRALVEGSKAPPRDPTRIVPGMRQRGKKQRR
ncbi:MAG: hypothetical protein KIT84_06530 [Labilithrix sp.]|nr:hypothetical protein [Labilithrix sp.]MCW5810648.1 hypothetical protein [Labilithrix sp.]